jgi:uncharacterized cupredoxin-like copper-binding protein
MHTDRTHTAPARTLRRRTVLAMLATGASAGLLAACGGGSATATTAATGTLPTTAVPPTGTSGATVSAASDSAPNLVIDAVDYAFRTNGSAAAGMTMVRMRNLGQEDHQTQFMRLEGGVTLAQVQAAFQTDPNAVTRLAMLVGGPGTAPAGGTSAALMDLHAGQYLLACFIPGRDGVAHAAKGMVLPLQVMARTGPAAPAPATDGRVVMREFSFALSASSFPAGRRMIAVVNEGVQPHEFAVLRLSPGKSAADVTQFFVAPAGPPPFAAAGGTTALSPGQHGIAVLDLTPGNYAVTCFVPDPASGKNHLQLGMIAGFSVT